MKFKENETVKEILQIIKENKIKTIILISSFLSLIGLEDIAIISIGIVIVKNFQEAEDKIKFIKTAIIQTIIMTGVVMFILFCVKRSIEIKCKTF